MTPERWVACHDCDLLHRLGEIPEGAAARCRRCGSLLRKRRPRSIERTLALVAGAAVLFVVANTFPFLSFDMKGQETQTTLITGVTDLWQQDMPEVAGLVLLTIFLAPLLQIAILLYVLLPLQWNRVPWQMARAFRLLRRVEPWSMMEVFMIGILVAVVKLMDMAQIVPGLALWAFVMLFLLISGAVASLDPDAVWERAEELQ
jgi:paraquat-inducible protein A